MRLAAIILCPVVLLCCDCAGRAKQHPADAARPACAASEQVCDHDQQGAYNCACR